MTETRSLLKKGTGTSPEAPLGGVIGRELGASPLSQQCDVGLARRRGAVLVLVLLYLALASSLMVLITAGSVQLVRTTRHEHESILLRQLTDSARAWGRVQRDLPPDTHVTLSGGNIPPEGVSGEVRISVDTETPDAVVIRAQLSFPDREVVRTTRFAVPP
ncbi:MAG: hypothetical protein ACYTFA_08505 [Planctomycetota bacterium]|jgi:hypothetical protein